MNTANTKQHTKLCLCLKVWASVVPEYAYIALDDARQHRCLTQGQHVGGQKVSRNTDGECQPTMSVDSVYISAREPQWLTK